MASWTSSLNILLKNVCKPFEKKNYNKNTTEKDSFDSSFFSFEIFFSLGCVIIKPKKLMETLTNPLPGTCTCNVPHHPIIQASVPWHQEVWLIPHSEGDDTYLAQACCSETQGTAVHPHTQWCGVLWMHHVLPAAALALSTLCYPCWPAALLSSTAILSQTWTLHPGIGKKSISTFEKANFE